MDPSSAPFKSPRPPAPRKARAGGSLSRQSSRQSLKDAFGAAPAHETVPPVPDAPLSGLGLAMNDVNAMDIRHNNSNANDSLQEILNGPSNEILAAQQQHSSNNNNTTTTAAAVLSRLEGLLVAKSNEIQLAGRLGEALLSQQAELESRIRELEDEVKKNEDHDHVFGNGGKQKTRQYNKNTVNGIHNDDDDDDSDIESAALVDERVKEKLKELENEMMRWEKGNEQIYKEVGVPSGTGSELVRQASSSSMRPEQPNTPTLPKSTSQNALQDSAIIDADGTPLSPSQSRRQRNAQHRANDIEFATEIGQSLLVEVRRLQSLLTERDAQLAASKTEKDGMERSMEALAGGLKSVEESLDKYREENWNLEVQNQEVKTQFSELQANFNKTESERNKLSKELNSARELLDGHKVDNERLVAQLETLQNKHDTDMANMRRTTAGLQREKTDLQSALDAAKNELVLRARGIRRSVSAASANTLGTSDSHHAIGGMGGDLAEEDEDEEDDVFGTGRRGTGRRKTNDHLLDSPSPMFNDGDSSLASDINSPAAFKNLSEAEKLRGNLAHAHKTIQTLRAALTREKEAKMAFKRRLVGGKSDTGEEDELSDDDDEDDFEDDEVDENRPEKRRTTITSASARRGRGGRGGIVGSRRGGALAGRLPRGLQPSSLSGQVPSGDEDSADGSIIEYDAPRDVSTSSEQEELASLPGEDDMHHGGASVFGGSMNSLAAMDPAFADILPSSRSQAVGDLARGSTRDNRPNSMMFSNDLNLMEQIRRQGEEIERLKAIPPPPEPVETKEISIMTDEIVPPKIEVREFAMQTEQEPVKEVKNLAVQTDVEPVKQVKESSVQTEPEPVKEVKNLSMQTIPEPVKEMKNLSMQTIPEPVKEIRDVSMQTVPAAIKKARDFAIQTDKVEVEQVKPETVIVTVPPPPKESKTWAMQTDDIEVQKAEIATMTNPETVIPKKDIEMMTVPKELDNVSTQTVPRELDNVSTQTDKEEVKPGKPYLQLLNPVAPLKRASYSVPVLPPAPVMVDQGLDPHVDFDTLLKQSDQDHETSANLSAMSFTGNDQEVATPKLESTPTFSTKALPDGAELIAPDVPESSYSHQMRRDDSSISHSFKSFSVRDTDYDTAAETDGGDFEDARDTLATFNTASPGLTQFANVSQSTIMHSARGSPGASDGESDSSVRAPVRYRRSSRARSRELTAMGEKAPPLSKPVMVEVAVQTDIIPTTMVTSPTMTPGFVNRELPSMASPPENKRLSVTSYGDTTVDSSDTARPTGLVYLETVRPTVEAPPNSASTSISPGVSPVESEFASLPASPVKARTPKLSIPPPPSNPPSRETLKHSMSPTFKPPRPSSPPPKDLLQRAQTPTFLAPGSVSRKRHSAANDGTPGTPGQYGTMPLHRNEAHFGASPAPLGRNRQPTQPRATMSSNQLRSSTPGIRYQAASTEPNEFGRQGAVTPVNQMAHPPSRYGSTRRQRGQGHSSRASMSSMGSAHSRNPSIASSARTSDAGIDGLPTPGADLGAGAGIAGSTDPAVIHAITQAMIGEFLFKYTRTTFTKGHSDKRHQRFFWIHPYTKTLYWSNSDPGAEGVNQSKAKSVFIAGVHVEKDSNPYPPGLYQHSIVISTIGREIKLTAPTQERHEMWMMAINYLLAREDGPPTTAPSAVNGPGTPSSRFSSFGKSVNRSAASLRFRQKSDPLSLSEAGVLVPSTGSNTNTPNDSTLMPRNRAGKNVSSIYQQESRSEAHLTATKKARKMSNATSLYKRSDTPAAEYENFIAEYGSPRSVRSYRTGNTAGPSGGKGKEVDESLEIIDRRDVLGAEGDGYEGLENVRACCNGEHDVGKLSVSKKHSHHHHQGTGQSYDNGTVKSSAGRSNSVASKASRRTGRLSAFSQEPPVPSLSNEPPSPSIRSRSHSTTLKGLSRSVGSPGKAMQRDRSGSHISSASTNNNPFTA